MADFKKLSAVDTVETVSDAAHVLIEEDGVIKRAPKDEVGGVKVTHAEVGQTIVVKAVDGNGVPTEWECVDIDKTYHVVSDGNCGDPALFVTSGIYEAMRAALEGAKPISIVVRDYGNFLPVDEFSQNGDHFEVYFCSPWESSTLFVYEGDEARLMYME